MKHMTHLCVSLVVSLALLGCVGAGRGKGAFANSTRIDFQGPAGRVAIRFEPRGESIRVEGRNGKVLATLRFSGERLLIEDPDGRAIGLVQPPGEDRRRFRVRSPSDDRAMFELKRDPDGDWKAYDASGHRIASAKRRDYGFKIVSEDGQFTARVRDRSGKISLRDDSGNTYLSTRDPIPAEAAAVLGLEMLPFEFAAGLTVAVIHWAPQGDP